MTIFPLLSSRVSIHAPTGGATVTCKYVPYMTECFNPRAHGRRDLSVLLEVPR